MTMLPIIGLAAFLALSVGGYAMQCAVAKAARKL
jgi:hypothetical protein